MVRFGVLAFLAMPVLGFAQGTGPGTPDAVTLLSHGVICAVDLWEQEASPNTESGELNIIDQTRSIDVVTTLVPAEIGLSFGIQTILGAGPDLDELTVVVTHPPMGTRGVTSQSWPAGHVATQKALNLYTFERDYELVQGPWRFTLMLGDTALIQQDFTVAPRGHVPAVQAMCNGPTLTS